MSKVTREVERILALLRNKIRERGFTQLEVQAKLGWGRSYISQLLTGHKNLRVDQVLLILEAIGVASSDFYEELYPKEPEPPARVMTDSVLADSVLADSELFDEYLELRAVVRGLVHLLVDKEVVGLEEILTAAEATDPRLTPATTGRSHESHDLLPGP